MPEKALEHRARQLSYLTGKAHGLLTSKRTLKLLERAETDMPENPTQAANVRGLRRDIDRATKLPQKLVEEESQVCAMGKAAWVEARAKSDFALFAQHLEKILTIARKKADLFGYEGEPYDALLDLYERGAKTREVAALFAKLRPQLAEIAREAVAKSKKVKPGVLKGRYPIEKQQILNREIAESLGFDFGAGRIDTTAHPFCTTLGPGDVRLTTRYDERDFLSSLFGVMHETGHGLYEQGLPGLDYGLPSGSAASLGIHESQSRLWENQVARGPGFWRHFGPRWRELFPAQTAGLSADDLALVVAPVAPTLIRVEADEVTYNLHIVLRFELERRLFAGDLDVEDLPEAWRALSVELLGLAPAHAGEGVLQDVHWGAGLFGYFPSYCLGNMIAAQLWARVRALRPGIEEEFACGDFSWLLAWLREHIHAAGRRHSALELVRAVTGEELSPQHLVAYLRARYGALYLGGASC